MSLLIDEAHNVLTPSVAKMLAEGRSAGLEAVFAWQYSAQIRDEVIRSGVRSLLQSISIFRMREIEDARSLAGLAMEVYSDRISIDQDEQERLRFSPDDILRLPVHQAINLWIADGTPRAGFVAHTLPMEALHDASVARAPPRRPTRPRRPPPRQAARPARLRRRQAGATRSRHADQPASRAAEPARAREARRRHDETGQTRFDDIGRAERWTPSRPATSRRTATTAPRSSTAAATSSSTARCSRATSRSSATSGATSSSPHRSYASSGGQTPRVQAADRRLLKLFRAGHLDRFRPFARRGTGSYPWTYHLGEEGHRLLQHAGVIPRPPALQARAPIFDYGHVLHDIQLNAWVLAYRRALGDALLAWDGETTIDPPAGLRREQRALRRRLVGRRPTRDRRARRSAPTPSSRSPATSPARPAALILIEYDRTRRLDKNYDKFHRYDAFLTWWWHHTPLGNRRQPPFVLFVCQDDEQRAAFLDAADRELTGHRWHPDVPPDRYEYVGRQRILFATEIDAHARTLEARRAPRFPVSHDRRQDGARRVWIGAGHDRRAASVLMRSAEAAEPKRRVA